MAESGILTDNISNKNYDRIFRRSLIEIYRKIGLPPPPKYFLPLIEKKPVEPAAKINNTLDVECNGKIGPGEWKGAYRVNFDSKIIKSFWCGFDGSNIYFRFDISSDSASEIRVNLGHMNADAAALYPDKLKHIPEVIQDFPISTEVSWKKVIPLKTIIYRASQDEQWDPLTGNYNVGYSSSILEFSLPFKYFGVRSRKKIYMKTVVDGKILPAGGHMEITAPELYSSRSIISNIDPALDNYGPGNYAISKEYEDYKGDTDFRKIDVNQRSGEKVIALQFTSINNIDNAPLGFGNALIDIYIDINNKTGLGNTSLLPGRKAYLRPEDAWEYAVVISGDKKAVYNTAGDKIGEPEVSVSLMTDTINIFIDEELIETSVQNWGVAATVMAAAEDGKLLTVNDNLVTDKYGFSGRKYESDTNILDIIVPPGFRQKDILGKNRYGEAIEIPAVRKR